MSILRVYLNWANSVLSEVGQYVDGVAAIQGGRILCDLIDILAPKAGLVKSVEKVKGQELMPQIWIEKALDHMQSHGIKYTFTVQDILDGDIKSLLDVLWLTILNYSLHNIEQNAYQRSVGIGKKYLMEWCEQQLNTQFDPRNTFSFNLCQGSWFAKLLQKHVGEGSGDQEDRVTALTCLLDIVEEKLSISRDILSASDILDGTVDEHTLMIYVALLRRRVGGNESLRAYSRLRKPPGGMNMDIVDAMRRSRSSSPASRYKSQSEDDERYSSDSELLMAEETRAKQNNNHSVLKKIPDLNQHAEPTFVSRKEGLAEEVSDWISSSSRVSTHSEIYRHNHSPNDDVPVHLSYDGETMLKETISQQVHAHMPLSGTEEDRAARNSMVEGVTSRDGSTGSHSSVNRGVTNRVENIGSHTSSNREKRDVETDKTSCQPVKIKRPKDYFLQWEDTLDRLSQGPSSSSDLIQSSRSQSEHDIEFGSDMSRSSSRSRSRSHETKHTVHDSIVHSSSLERERRSSPEGFYRTKAHSHPDSMNKYRQDRTLKRDVERTDRVGLTTSTVSNSSQNDFHLSELNLHSLSGTTINDLKSHPMFPNLKSLLSTLDPEELDILNRSDKPPDVLTLLEKIKKARLAVDNNMPKETLKTGSVTETRDNTDVKIISDDGCKRRSVSTSPQRPAVDMQASERHQRGLSASPDRRTGMSPVQKSTERLSSYIPRTISPVVDCDNRYWNDADHLSEESFRHLPRREAWERQRNRSADIPIDVSRIDSLAQAKFIEVLCKEIEELKFRMDTMEISEDGHVSPMSRSPITSVRTPPPVQTTGTKIEPLSQYSDIHEQNGHMVFESSRSRSLSPVYTRQRRSPDILRRVPLNRTSDYNRSRSLSPKLELQRDFENRLRKQTSPAERDRGASLHSPIGSLYGTKESQYPVRQSSDFDTDGSRPQPRSNFSMTTGVQQLSLHNSDGGVRGAPVDGADQSRSISLGYSSPVRSVTQEIWGNKLNIIKGLEPERQSRWKSLIAMRELSDEDVIELKQALASCIVENDILQAKLRNAKADVSEKLFKTNDVLDDCRRHLAKSQAENMELRSNLEHERHKTEGMESRMKALEDGMYQAKSESKQLKTQVRETAGALDKALSELQPQEDLKKMTQHLKISLSTVESQNDSLQRDVEDLQYSNDKAQSTIKELRTCLEEVREERSQLFQEINALHASNQKSKVANIIKHYSDDGITGETEKESRPSSAGHSRPSNSDHSASTQGRSLARRSRIDDYVSTRVDQIDSKVRAHRRTSTWENELDSDHSKLNSSLNLSGTYDTTSSKDTGYSTEEMRQSPTIPSSFREIYPHRKAQYYREKMSYLDARASPIPFVDYPDLQQYPNKLGYSEYDVDGDYRVLSQTSKEYLSHGEQQPRSASYTEKFDQFESSQDYCSGRDLEETLVESPTALYQHSHIAVSDRLSNSLQEPQLRSHQRSQRSGDRLNHSCHAEYEQTPGNRQVSSLKKGILKNGREIKARLRERSCSPVLQRYGRSHSPPTRLSPGVKSVGDSKPTERKAVYGRSSSARRVARTEELQLVKDWDLKSSYSRAKSWYELQLKDNDAKKDRITEITEKLGQEPTILSDAQRRYADHLIEKYTGQRIPNMDVTF